MQTESLSQIKHRIVSLDEDSKRELAEFLASELSPNSESVIATITDEDRQLQLQWLMANRERYAGKYVALSGDTLVGEGKTFREASDAARTNGYSEVFVTVIYSENDLPFGGW